MVSNAEKQRSDSQVDSTVLSKLVRSTVINNSQIIGGVARGGLLLGFAAILAGVWIRETSSAQLRETLRTVGLSLLVTSAGFMLLSLILDRALRRCPICRTRITRKTEERRRCLEYDTELWGY